MNLRPMLSILAIALLGCSAMASATESARHNDLDGDGRSDLIWRNAGTGAIVYWRSADIRASVQMPYNSDLRTWSPVFAISDFWENPSRADLMLETANGAYAGFNPFDGQIVPFDNDGPYPIPIGHGDFDGNGWADVLSRDPRSGQNYIQFGAMVGNFMVQGATTDKQLAMVGLSWKVVGIGDFDGDGRSDILWRDATTGHDAIWRSGDSTTRLAIANVTDLNWKVAAVGDFDGDGRSDILWRHARTGANVIWKSGNLLTRQAVTTVADTGWMVAATGDFDGDGAWDLVWRNARTGANVIWKSAQISTRQTLPTVGLAWTLVM